MKFLSVFSNKGFVLYPFLLLFLSTILVLNSITLNLFQRTQESKNAYKLDQFSLVEIQSIQLIKLQFLTFNPKNFETNIGEWTIKVKFTEELANIIYSGPQTINASMHYDTVFKNILDYKIIDASKGNSD